MCGDSLKVVSNILINANEVHRNVEWQQFSDVLNGEEGYKVQNYVYKKLNGESDEVAAYKVSLTSEKSQKGYEYNQPIYGQLRKNQVVLSKDTVKLSNQFHPFLEVEVGFKVKSNLLPEDSLDDLLKKVDILPSFELPDSRFKDWFRKLGKELFMADDAMANLLVVGKIVNTSNLTVDDVADITMRLNHDNHDKGCSKASSVLGNPLFSLQWLVKKLANQGSSLKPGQFITTGTSKTVDLEKGLWEAQYSNGLGNIELKVED